MNGAELLLKTAIEAGVEICFANAGTTELYLVAAFDSVQGIRPILGLFEGVCTGAADGYGRMKQRPAMNLLHLGPGLANGIANLHNARRAGTPVLNVIGEHATWHRQYDPPLNMDIGSLAKTVSGWHRVSESAGDIARDTAEAVSATLYGQISTLIVPSDYQWSECTANPYRIPSFRFDEPDSKVIEEAATLIRKSTKPALLLGGSALRLNGLDAAARIQAATGCDLLSVTFPAYHDRGEGLPVLTRLPYFPEQVLPVLAGYDSVVLAGATEPVSSFGYPGVSSRFLKEEQTRIRIDGAQQDPADALSALADMVVSPFSPSRRSKDPVLARLELPAVPSGTLDPKKLCAVIAALQPEDCIVVDEGICSSFWYQMLAPTLRRHSYLTLTGGSIGMGMPCALGAALACPERKVINIQADGSAMYTLQALWTQAHTQADVVTLICSNRKYFTIEFECRRAGCIPGADAMDLIGIDHPPVDWVRLGRGMGVRAVSVATAEELASELKSALKESGPHLIEVVI